VSDPNRQRMLVGGTDQLGLFYGNRCNRNRLWQWSLIFGSA
jgi:hypothetical protein